LNGGEAVDGERCPVSGLVQNLQSVQFGTQNVEQHDDASHTRASINGIEGRIGEHCEFVPNFLLHIFSLFEI
jgi:hypothetical protein